MGKHYFPTRLYVISMIRQCGAKAVYGNKWKHTDGETLEMLLKLTDAQYVERCGCDHHDEQGNCLGHDDDGRKRA